jgi:hypothetical protein
VSAWQHHGALELFAADFALKHALHVGKHLGERLSVLQSAHYQYLSIDIRKKSGSQFCVNVNVMVFHPGFHLSDDAICDSFFF